MSLSRLSARWHKSCWVNSMELTVVRQSSSNAQVKQTNVQTTFFSRIVLLCRHVYVEWHRCPESWNLTAQNILAGSFEFLTNSGTNIRHISCEIHLHLAACQVFQVNGSGVPFSFMDWLERSAVKQTFRLDERAFWRFSGESWTWSFSI